MQYVQDYLSLYKRKKRFIYRCRRSALQQAGFLRAIVREFWASLECSDDMYVSAPRSYPLSPVERSVHKVS